jgi:6-phosphogluconolactonase/glucosamine-6-phosphate isomerase/deaminase
MEQTSRAYAKSLWTNIEKCDYTIAFAGMGQDGHIFGIKPGSPSVKSNDLVEAYEWDDYARITPTFKLLRRLDEVVIYAAGKEKWPQLENLDHNLPDNDQPAQMLKRLKKVIIFNDYKGEPV